MEESPEFYLLRPICVAVVKEPSEEHLQKFQDVFSLLTMHPEHLGDYVIFPFALHLKRLPLLRDKIKAKLVQCLAQVLKKFDVKSWDMFVEIYQRLHLALGKDEDPTQVKEMPEDLLEEIVSTIKLLGVNNLPTYFDTLYGETKIKILAHSIFLLLQITSLDLKKSIRCDCLDIIQLYISSCKGKEEESRRVFKFLPGIVSSVRKVVDVRVGRAQSELFLKGVQLLQESIIVTTHFEENTGLVQPDLYLGKVFADISPHLLTNENDTLRNSWLRFCINLLDATACKLPSCRETLINDLMVLRTDINASVSTRAENALLKYAPNITLCYSELLEMINKAKMLLEGKHDVSCATTLARLNFCFINVKFNYFELKEFLEVLFTLMCDAFKGFQNCCLYDATFKKNIVATRCADLCASVFKFGNYDDIIEIFESRLTDFNGDVQTNFIGCVLCFNEIVRSSLLLHPTVLLETDVIRFSDYYLNILHVQSTELVLSILEAEAPKTQSVVDARKGMLLEGIGLMAKLYPTELLSVTLYTLVEYAGLDSSTVITDTARSSLKYLAFGKSMEYFLKENLSGIMNHLSVRISNLSLHPNSPNSLIFLAGYFDFSKTMLMNIVDQVFLRSCDPFSGGHLQFLYTKVFYAFILSLWTRKDDINTDQKENKINSFLSHKQIKQTFLDGANEYQRSLGIPLSEIENSEENQNQERHEEEIVKDGEDFSPERKACPKLGLVNKICQRVLNFLPNVDRSVRLLSMDCLIKGIYVLEHEEDLLLPLAHTIWQNLVPRLKENDYVVVRKAFELLLALCMTCGSFLKKRTVQEIFPVLSVILVNLAKESESVKDKNRKYYTYTQAYKLQLTVLQGLSEICKSIDIQEEELNRIIDGCLLYMNPRQHKLLQEAARNLIDSLVSDDSPVNYRSVWMKLVVSGLRDVDAIPPHPTFTPVASRVLEQFRRNHQQT